MALTTTIQAGASVTLNIVEHDNYQNAVTPAAANLTATSSDPSVLTAVISSDGATVAITSTGKEGSATVTVTDTHANLSDTATIAVAAGVATSLTLQQ